MNRIKFFIIMCVMSILLVACGGSEKHIDEAKTPSGSSAMKGRNYESVVQSFEDNGFINIHLEKIEDLITGWLTKDGEVEKVTVGGDENYSVGQWVPNDIEVVIYYHTFSTEDSENEEKVSKEEHNNLSVEKETTNMNEETYYEFELNSNGDGYILSKFLSTKCDNTELIIPNTHNGLPVVEIAEQAFYAKYKIEKIILPEGIEKIGAYAFYHCEDIKEIVFPNSLYSIGEYAFEGCDSLVDIRMPSCTNIGFRAFCECENLENITLGDVDSQVAQIEGYAFYNCKKLKMVCVGTGYTLLDSHAFSQCENLSTVDIPDTVNKFGDSAFEFCNSLKTINYNGTDEQWIAIDKWPWWDKDTGNYSVNCKQE